MSETETAVAGEHTNEHTPEQPKEFQAITSQEDLDRIIQGRIDRERKKIPTDYEELKAKAAEHDKYVESQKTEAQKQQEALAEAQAQLAELTAGKLRAEVAAAKGVPANLLTGSTQEELEASADALITFKGEQQPQKLHIPLEGRSPTNAAASPAQDFAQFMETQLGS